MSIDFSKVKKIVIPEGNVKKIVDSSNRILWEQKIYGVKWTGGTTTSLTRTDDAVGLTATPGKGTVKGSSSFDKIEPWASIKKVTDGNNVLVSIPKFYYKWTKSSSTLTLQISDKYVDGFYVSPMHMNRGDGKGEREIAYIGRYKCASSTYYSKTGQTALANMSRATARSKIKALGTGYYQADFAAFWTLRMLFLVEYATWDGVSLFNRVEASAYQKTGGTDAMTYHTGTSANSYNIQYRYVENPWAMGLEWIDGIYMKSGVAYGILNPTKFSDTTNGTNLGTFPTDGYIKSFAIPSNSNFKWALIPSATGGSATTYIPDYTYGKTATNGVCMYSGGSRTVSLSQNGPFMMYYDFTTTQTSTAIFTRLMKLP